MSTFSLTIRMGNEAMQTPDDLAEALEAVAALCRERAVYPQTIRDRNGNTVGDWVIEADPYEAGGEDDPAYHRELRP